MKERYFLIFFVLFLITACSDTQVTEKEITQKEDAKLTSHGFLIDMKGTPIYIKYEINSDYIEGEFVVFFEEKGDVVIQRNRLVDGSIKGDNIEFLVDLASKPLFRGNINGDKITLLAQKEGKTSYQIEGERISEVEYVEFVNDLVSDKKIYDSNSSRYIESVEDATFYNN